MNNELQHLINFLDILENRKIFYTLKKIRDGILVDIAVPGQRWEVEFMSDGSIEIEKFFSSGEIFGEKEIENLLKDFSD